MQLDASISETHLRTAIVSQNPIEDGSNVSDHITLNPEALTITGLVSDVPLSFLVAAVGTGVGAITEAVAGPLGGIGKTLAAAGIGSLGGLVSGTPRDPKDAFKYLEELFKDRFPFTVITALKRYDDMVISNLNVPRSATVGKGLQFTINLEKIIIVENSFVIIPSFKLAANAKNRGQSTSKLGKQAAKEAKEKTKKGASILSRLFF